MDRIADLDCSHNQPFVSSFVDGLSPAKDPSHPRDAPDTMIIDLPASRRRRDSSRTTVTFGVKFGAFRILTPRPRSTIARIGRLWSGGANQKRRCKLSVREMSLEHGFTSILTKAYSRHPSPKIAIAAIFGEGPGVRIFLTDDFTPNIVVAR